jgi:hypothetical protein
MAETRLSRMKQLAKGTRSAAAALPAESQEISQRVSHAAEAWSHVLGGLEEAVEAPPGLEPVLQPAVSMLESLHFELLQMGVLEREPDEVAIEDAVTELNRLAEEAARLVGESLPSD